MLPTQLFATSFAKSQTMSTLPFICTRSFTIRAFIQISSVLQKPQTTLLPSLEHAVLECGHRTPIQSSLILQVPKKFALSREDHLFLLLCLVYSDLSNFTHNFKAVLKFNDHSWLHLSWLLTFKLLWYSFGLKHSVVSTLTPVKMRVLANFLFSKVLNE